MSDQLKPGPWLAIHEELGVEPPEFDDRPLGAFVEDYAESIADNSALRYLERDISYRELNELSNRLANALATLGVGLGDVVGLHMPNVPQYGVALVAASKLGAVASGVSPLLAPAEVANQLEDASVKVLISLDTLLKPMLEVLDTQGSLPECLTAVIVTGADDLRQPVGLELPILESVTCKAYLELTADASPEFNQVDLPPDHICLIQYTGGTTGKPKGAMLTLRGIMYNIVIAHLFRPWEVGTETAFNALPPTHIGGCGTFLWAFRYGARMVLIPDARDIDHYCQQMIECPPTRLSGVPTLYQMIADHPLSAEIDFSHLKFAMCGAAPITGEDRKRIEGMLQGTVLSDGYGMTEGGPTVIVNPPQRCKPESVGIPIPSVDVRIVDVETGTREMPYGEAGEIIISSPSLMKGYLNRPDETANSLREWHGRTWMHSGDVGVMDKEGYVYLKDRAKDMIIVSGFKVFSVEVEDKLAGLEFIALSALIGSPDVNRPGSEIVNLYVELTPEAKQLDPDQVRTDIREFCRAEMAAYKVPKVIHLVDAIPLTPVGKIDKKMLRDQAAQECAD
ncbi:MAG: long-chain fatty acid--CoA ligase [Gammaproteobacteria bacterium]|nr:long-chain fatty acid--CoA ligase [Gammaproteobacteria bacterium]MYF10060.1 long-chain fatty acid--CoA ligase [Gammaproteobacteria bacterium]MYK28035.1 long-chain fatty acid--CoA ligase [Gammaproteobacteria bacterium]